MPTVYVVTAVHNYLGHTKALLRSLARSSYKNIKIIVVDDGSTDGTSVYLKKTWPDVSVIRGDGNLWWTGGINRAIKYVLSKASEHDYILTINNDCTFNEKYISRLLLAAGHKKRVIVGSIEYDQKTKKIQTGFLTVVWERGEYRNNIRIRSEDPREADMLLTKGTLFPVSAFQEIGLLDERHLPHYGSDFEFTMRAKRAGYSLIIDPTCRVYCDSRRTGITPETLEPTVRNFWDLLFSQKSSVNIFVQFYLIKLNCPPKLRLRNYGILLKRTISHLIRLYAKKKK